ncbi:hypothetical protein [Stenotrophomonas sp. YIM B06876]|uniref:hypothetical protein n=1 Tax=Stenotrophomonas sp. YIM B06876 TaxID=3060211 RepID=UPI002738E3C4|nr:hypothetical protein [Stenotrophomonas sp. YIM B06876]
MAPLLVAVAAGACCIRWSRRCRCAGKGTKDLPGMVDIVGRIAHGLQAAHL